jgi:uncharacterized protein YyaL (SSP411 family)
MIQALWNHYLPAVMVIYLPGDDSRTRLISLAPFTGNMNSTVTTATAHICTAHTCAMPTTDVRQMMALLGEKT